MTWQSVGTHSFVPTDKAVQVGSFDLAAGQDTIWVRITQLNPVDDWPWSYGILSWRNANGTPLGSIKAYSNRLGEVFRLGNGLPPSDGTGSLWFEPRGFNLGWLKAGFPWELQFEAQSGDSRMSETYWSRIPGTLAPSNAGDDVNLDTGSLSCKDVLIGNDDVQLLSSRRVVVGNSASSSADNRRGIDLRAEDAYENARVVVQGTSATSLNAGGFSLYRGTELVWILRYSGDATFRGLIDTSDISLRSDDPGFLQRVGGETQYVGPELSLKEEIVRLESLVKHLYETLRLAPPAGWEVWDGSQDVVKRLGKKPKKPPTL